MHDANSKYLIYYKNSAQAAIQHDGYIERNGNTTLCTRLTSQYDYFEFVYGANNEIGNVTHDQTIIKQHTFDFYKRWIWFLGCLSFHE